MADDRVCIHIFSSSKPLHIVSRNTTPAVKQSTEKTMTMMSQNAILLAALYILVLSTVSTARQYQYQYPLVRSTVALLHPTRTHRRQISGVRSSGEDSSAAILLAMRGGSTAAEANDEANSSEASANGSEDGQATEIDDDENEDEGAASEGGSKPASVSSMPARLVVQTNWGNAVLDQRLEITAGRTKNIAAVKKSVSRSLPGKPPLLGLELVFEGKVLDDEMLVDELFDDDDEEEDEDDDESDESFKVLTLNSVPPVDPRFAIELGPKLKSHVEDDEDTLSTEELVEAFFLNQAAMSRNAQLLADPKAPSSPVLRLEIQQQALQLKEQLKSQVPADVWESSLKAIKRDHHVEEIRGQRYRSGKGGARTSLKKSIQTNLNIDWVDTIRNFLLLLFFGYFGGRNSISRTLMLWGAPLCFVMQARPVKMWSKIAFYMMSNPPGVVSSLLPAPQQAILNADLEKSYAALYRPDEEQETEKASVTAEATTTKARFMKEDQEPVVDDEVDATETEDEEQDEDESDEEEDDDGDDDDDE